MEANHPDCRGRSQLYHDGAVPGQRGMGKKRLNTGSIAPSSEAD